MSQSLTPEQIAALVEAAKDGGLQDEAPAATQRRAPRLRTIDFTRPTKFTADQERRLEPRRSRASAAPRRPVCRPSCASPIELEVIDLDAAHVVDRAVAAADELGLRRASTSTRSTPQMLLSAELPFVLCALERAARRPRPRTRPRTARLTEIDWALARRLFGSMVEQLSIIWSDVAEVDLALGVLEGTTENAADRAVQRADAVADGRGAHRADLARRCRCSSPSPRSRPVSAAFSQRDGAGPVNDDGASGEAVDAALRGVEITVRAEVSDRNMTVAEVLALQPGDVLRLDGPASHGVTLFADQVPVHRARPGRNGTQARRPDPRPGGGRAMNADDALIRLGESTSRGGRRRSCRCSPATRPSPGAVTIVGAGHRPAPGLPDPGRRRQRLLRRRRHRRQRLRHAARRRPRASPRR